MTSLWREIYLWHFNLPSTSYPDVVLQRRRSAEDELTMREYLQEGDLISVMKIQLFTGLSSPDSTFTFFLNALFLISQAEVQSIFADGALSLHTRSLKYGKVSHMPLDWEKSTWLLMSPPPWASCFLYLTFSWAKVSSCSSPRLWSRGRKHISTICHVVHPLSWGIMALCGCIPRQHNRKRRLGASTPAWRWAPNAQRALNRCVSGHDVMSPVKNLICLCV